MPLDRRAGIAHGYPSLAQNDPGAPVGYVFSGRLNRSCDWLQATCWPAQRDFGAYPHVCRDVAWCGHWRTCQRAWRREHVIKRAQAAVHFDRLRALWCLIAR